MADGGLLRPQLVRVKKMGKFTLDKE